MKQSGIFCMLDGVIQVLLPKRGSIPEFQIEGILDSKTQNPQFLLQNGRGKQVFVSGHHGVLHDSGPIFLGITHGVKIDEGPVLTGGQNGIVP